MSNTLVSRFILFAFTALCCFCMLYLDNGFCQNEPPVVRFSQGEPHIALGPFIQFQGNVPEEIRIQEISSPEFSGSFIQNNSQGINLGTTDQASWFRFYLALEEREVSNQYTRITSPCVVRLLYLGKQLDFYDEITIYWRKKQQNSTDSPVQWHQQTYGAEAAIRKGRREPLYIPISLDKGSLGAEEFYLRIQSEMPVFIEPSLHAHDSFFQFISELKIFYGIYYGLVLSMIIYHAFHYFFMPDMGRILFILYATATSLYFLVANELMGTIFPTSFLAASTKISQFIGVLVLLLCACFALVFLEVKKNQRIHYFLLCCNIVILMGCILALLFFSYHFMGTVLPYVIIGTVVVIISAGVFSWKQGYRPALFFLLAWTFLLGGALIYALNFMGVFPYPFIGNNAAQIGSGMEMLLFSLAIADKVKYHVEQLQQKQRKKEKQVQRLSRQLILAEESERRRLAEKLHDSVGQALCTTKWEVQKLLHEAVIPESNSARTLQQIDFCIQETRSVTTELYPQVLYQFGLLQALSALANEYSERYGLNISTHYSDSSNELSEELQYLLYRIVSELLHNVKKHARAKNVSIHARGSNSALSLSVVDDGVGFEYSQELCLEKKSLGLFSVQERLQQIGGDLLIMSHPNKGSNVTLKVPLNQTSRREED